MTTVVLVGTLDTKGSEYAFVKEKLIESGCEVITVNAGVLADPEYPVEFGRNDVASMAGVSIDDLTNAGERGRAVTVMAEGAAGIVSRLYREGRVDGLFGMGGSGGSSIASRAMSSLPLGVPKLLVSTMASGNIAHYVGSSDVTVMYPVVDIAGINRVSGMVLTNAVAAIAGMAKARAGEGALRFSNKVVGVTMYGATTQCVNRARADFEELGYEVLVFHATGTGGRSMERLMAEGIIQASLDVTTAEVMAEIAGGTFTAGPARLEAAGEKGLPQVVSTGGSDMIAFTPPGSLPDEYENRLIHAHNPHVTLVRTTPEETAHFGRLLAAKLNQATGPVSLFLPLQGSSSYSAPGAVFYDPVADDALADAVRSHLNQRVELVELDTHINDPVFARAMAQRLHQLIASS